MGVESGVFREDKTVSLAAIFQIARAQVFTADKVHRGTVFGTCQIDRERELFASYELSIIGEPSV